MKIKSPLLFPVPFRNEYEEYIDDVCLDLYYTGARKFNIITYANILFLLEKYTCHRVQSENFENKCKELLRDLGKMNECDIEETIEELRYKPLPIKTQKINRRRAVTLLVTALLLFYDFIIL